MTWRNAVGFLLIGLGMLWLPDMAPGLFAGPTAFGTSTRELWLLFMGTLNAALGGGVLGWRAVRQAWRIPVWLQPVPESRPRLRPALHAPAPARAHV